MKLLKNKKLYELKKNTSIFQEEINDVNFKGWPIGNLIKVDHPYEDSKGTLQNNQKVH